MIKSFIKKIVKKITEKKIIEKKVILSGSKTILVIRLISSTSLAWVYDFKTKSWQHKKNLYDPIDEFIDPPHVFNGEPAEKFLTADPTGQQFYNISDKPTIQWDKIPDILISRRIGVGDRFVITYYDSNGQIQINTDSGTHLFAGYTHPHMFDNDVTRFYLYPEQLMEFNIYHVKRGENGQGIVTTRESLKSLCNVSDDTPCNVIINFHYVVDNIIDGHVYFTQTMVEIFCDITG